MTLWVSTLNGSLYEVLSVSTLKKTYTVLVQMNVNYWVAQEIGYGSISECYSHSNISVFST
jgi:hypothetical protein